MREQFKSKYSDIDAFYARADLLRSQFGVWDARDPIAHIILDLVEAQSELSDLFEDEGLYGFILKPPSKHWSRSGTTPAENFGQRWRTASSGLILI